jgi:hypothetical protein
MGIHRLMFIIIFGFLFSFRLCFMCSNFGALLYYVMLQKWIKNKSCTLTSINNFTGQSAKKRTNVGFNQNSPFLHWEKSNPSLSIANNKGCTPLWPTQVRCFALSPVKLFMEVSVQEKKICDRFDKLTIPTWKFFTL